MLYTWCRLSEGSVYLHREPVAVLVGPKPQSPHLPENFQRLLPLPLLPTGDDGGIVSRFVRHKAVCTHPAHDAECFL